MKHLLSAMLAAAFCSGTAFAQSGDAARGERLFNVQCKTCHTLEKSGPQVTGPTLAGLFGRKAGAVEGYQASDAMKSSGIEWSEATLAEYLRDPKGRVPGTTMVHAGLKQPAQLADVVAYLKKAAQ
jgi:cytochrome c